MGEEKKGVLATLSEEDLAQIRLLDNTISMLYASARTIHQNIWSIIYAKYPEVAKHKNDALKLDKETGEVWYDEELSLNREGE